MKSIIVIVVACLNTFFLFSQEGTSLIELNYPNGGEAVFSGEDLDIKWKGVSASDTVRIEYSIDKGTSWRLLTNKASGLHYVWEKIPNLKSKQCLIRVSSGKMKVPNIEWQKTFGGTKGEIASTLYATRDGNYLVGGWAESNDGDFNDNKGGADFYLMKIDKSGKIVWQKNLGGKNSDFLHSVIELKDGRIVAVGYTYSSDGDINEYKGAGDYLVVTLNESGELLTQRTLGGNDADFGSSVSETSEGGFVVVGESSSKNGDIGQNKGMVDAWVVKFTSTGELLWEKSYGGTNTDIINSIKTTKDDGYILAGHTYSSDGDVTSNYGIDDAWLVKLDIDGKIEWQKTYGGTKEDQLYDVKQTSDGGYITVGLSKSNDRVLKSNKGGEDIWIIKLNSQGDIEWQKSLGGTKNDAAFSVTETYDNGYFIAGYSESDDIDAKINRGEKDFWVIKLNSKGTFEWQKSFGGKEDERAYSAVQTDNQGFMIVGLTKSNDRDVSGNKGGHDFWIVKLLSDYETMSSDNSDNLYSCTSSLVLRDTNYDLGIGAVGAKSSTICGDYLRNVSSISRVVDTVYFMGTYADYFEAEIPDTNLIPPKGAINLRLSYAPKYRGGHFADIVFVSGKDTVIGSVFAYVFEGTSINDNETIHNNIKSELSVYPNPANGHADICFTTLENVQREFEIVNTSGEIMFQCIHELSTSMSDRCINLNTSHLPVGVYWVRCKVLDRIYQKELIINR